MTRKKLIIIWGSAISLGALLALAIIFSGKPNKPSSTLDTKSLSSWIGQTAPDFALKDKKGLEVKLGDYRGRNLVLFFNEGIMCYPACWNQIAALGQDPKLNNDRVASLTVVNDAPADWLHAGQKMPELASARIIFDSELSVSQAYRVLSLPSSMHRGSRAGHTYFVIDPEGVIRYASDDVSMGVHNEHLIAEIQKIEAR